MKIEVGKTYKDGQGAEVRITHTRAFTEHPFVGVTADNDVMSYTAQGQFYHCGT